MFSFLYLYTPILILNHMNKRLFALLVAGVFISAVSAAGGSDFTYSRGARLYSPVTGSCREIRHEFRLRGASPGGTKTGLNP